MTQPLLSGSAILAGLALFAACSTPARDFADKHGSGGSGSAAGSGGVAGSSGARAGSSAGQAGSSTGSNGMAGDNSGPGGAGGSAPIDACVGLVCDAAPASSCTSGMQYRTYDKLGSCSAGECKYAEHLIACTCQGSACTSDPCATLPPCTTPPAAKCSASNTLTEYAASGTCSAGSCSYTATDKPCAFGCANGACKADPCAAMTCNTATPAKCKNTTTKTTYATSGACSAGTCSYAATDTPCPSNQACSGQGVCALCNTDASCGATCVACSGTTLKCKATSTTSACVGCLSNSDCTDPTTPVCNASTNACQARPSCVGLAKTCGPNGNQDCCTSSIVIGSTFNRGNDPAYPATVSTFRLDKYEVTVGRYRKFVAAFTPTTLAAGAGKNPNNSSDTGWNTAWAANMGTPDGGCMSPDAPIWTATAGSNESLPINCIDWYEAEAFCIWDGGRLPTEAEWNFAAAGGTAQRNYPWGGSAPDCTYANFWPSPACVSTVPNKLRVGSLSPKGDGVFGQSDLAGNVNEWVQDFYQDPYPGTCNNCANLTVGTERVVRGGSSSASAPYILTSSRSHFGAVNFPFDDFGMRCARNP